MQAKLKNFKKNLLYYEAAMKQLKTYLEILNTEISFLDIDNPINHVSTRIKSTESIILKLQRKVSDETESFYKNIEIKGYLHDTLKIWDCLPESKFLPKTKPFIREYVMRRYLLERDIGGIQHKYPVFGDIKPFITLFQHSDEYIKMGYSNTVDIAKRCVEARVAYKKSLNPVMRRLLDE